jgi:hypothetical protein
MPVRGSAGHQDIDIHRCVVPSLPGSGVPAPTSVGKSVVDVFSQTRQLGVVLRSFVTIDTGITVRVSLRQPFDAGDVRICHRPHSRENPPPLIS